MCTSTHGNAGVHPIPLLSGAGLLMVRGCLQPCHSTAWAGGVMVGLFLGSTEIQIIHGFAEEERGQVWEGAFCACGGGGCCCWQLPTLRHSTKMWRGSPLFHFKQPRCLCQALGEWDAVALRRANWSPGRSPCPTGAVCISVGKGATGQSLAQRVSTELGVLVWGLGVLRSP